jgi:DNA-binding transcriptional MerR regulator
MESAIKRGGVRVGELAKRAGVSVRTLHHYDAIGLLVPSQRSVAGYRMYGRADVARLQQIKSLRQLGFTLDEIGDCLRNPAFSPLHVIELHLARVRNQIERQRALSDRLEAIAARLRAAEEVSAEEFLQTMEAMTMVDKYYTPEQQAELAARREQLGEAGMRQAEADWRELMAQVQTEMDQGTDPADPRVQALARRWMDLVRGFNGGNPEIARSLRTAWQEETTIHDIDTGRTRAMMNYIAKAFPSPGPEA